MRKLPLLLLLAGISLPAVAARNITVEQLQQVLGITDVNYVVSGSSLAIVDSPLGG